MSDDGQFHSDTYKAQFCNISEWGNTVACLLNADESISDGIKGIILERVDRAINDLVDSSIDRDEGVHDARKSFKRVRAAYLGIIPEQVRAVIRTGKLPATKVGQEWIIEADASDLLNGEEMSAGEEFVMKSLPGTRQAAIRLGVFPSEVRALIGAGELPAFKVSRSWIIRKDDLEQLHASKMSLN